MNLFLSRKHKHYKSKRSADRNRRQRVSPRIYDFSYRWCHTHLANLQHMIHLLYKLSKNPTVLDIGCGDKPLQGLFLHANYIGVDISPDSAAEIIMDCNQDLLPLDNDSVDAIILSNSLEHIYDTQHIVNELRRVLRPQGLLYFSVPMTYPIHSYPHDYIRFTRYYFQRTFSDWETIELRSTNSLFSTPLLLFGQILETFLPPFVCFLPLLSNNLLSLLIDYTTKIAFYYTNSELLKMTWESCPMELSGIYKKT